MWNLSIQPIIQLYFDVNSIDLFHRQQLIYDRRDKNSKNESFTNDLSGQNDHIWFVLWFSIKLFIKEHYCLTACLYAKCCDLIGWILGTWTIYTFPYRRSGLFIQLSIKVKTQDFWEDGRETIDRSHEKFVTFGKLSVNFRKLSGKT